MLIETRTHYRKIVNLREGDEMFENAVHGAFNVTLMQEMLKNDPGSFRLETIPLELEHVRYVQGFVQVRQHVVRDMPEARRDEPGYAVWLDDPSPLLLIDGHHRLMRRWQDGLRTMDLWICPTELIPMIKISKFKWRK